MRLEDLNLFDPVEIGFYDPFSVFSSIEQPLRQCLPLANLHWRYHPHKPVKSIPLLPVSLVEEVPKTGPKSHGDCSKTFMRLMFIKLDTLDVYRSQIRPLICEWIKELVKPYNIAWAIVLVVTEDKKVKKLTLLKTSLHDKLKIDFGFAGKRLAELRIPTPQLESAMQTVWRLDEHYMDDITRMEAFNIVTTDLKSGILTTFNKRYFDGLNSLGKLVLDLEKDPEGKPLLHFEKVAEKLHLATILQDMRCLGEALESYQEAAESIDSLRGKFPECFDEHDDPTQGTKEWDEFDPERSICDIQQVATFVATGEKIRPLSLKLAIFVKISIVLQIQANFASSLSVSAMHVSLLYRHLLMLVTGLAPTVHTLEATQWAYMMIDFYLQLPLAQKLKELDQGEREGRGGPLQALFESVAELELLRRSYINKIAVHKGYQIPGLESSMESLSLDENPAKDLPLVSKLLRKLFESQASYEEAFKEITLASITNFAECERLKTVDVLSVDLALLHYKQGNYGEAFEVLSNSYEYFSSNGWNLIGGALLETYCRCAEKLDFENSDRILDSFIVLLQTLCSISPLGGINHFGIIKNSALRVELMESIKKLARKSSARRSIPLSPVFEYEINPLISGDEDTEKSVLQIKLTNNFNVDIVAENVKVTMTCVTADREILFSSNEVTLSRVSEVLLYSTEFGAGDYEVTSVQIQVAKELMFEEEFFDSDPDATVIHHATDEIPPERFVCHMFPTFGHFKLSFKPPREIELGKPALECIITNGPTDITNVEVKISTSSFGLNLKTETDNMLVVSLEPRAQHRHIFKCSSECKSLDIEAICTFDLLGQRHEYRWTGKHDLHLTVSISVQDIFKAETIYSKFQIACVNTKFPIRVSDCDFTCQDDKYDIEGLRGVFKKQSLLISDVPASLFYKVLPKTEFNSADVLDLNVTFSNVKDECEGLVNHLILERLRSFDKEHYYHFFDAARHQLVYDLKAFAIEKKLVPFNLDDCNHAANYKLRRFAPAQSDLKDLIKSLFDSANKVGDYAAAQRTEYQLYIPVPVPCLSVLHRLEFKLKQKTAVLGQVLDATLKVTSTSRWAGEASEQPATREFELNVIYDDDWVITGHKRHNFVIGEGDTDNEVEISLIPLNAGELALPKLSIRPRSGECSMDVIYENALETVSVRPELLCISLAF